MRVLHLYSGNLYGGVETLLATFARLRHLCPAMEPEFALCFRGRLWDELAAAAAPVHDLGAARVSRPWTVLRARKQLKALLRARRFDVAVAHMGWPHALFAPVARTAGVRLAHALHAVTDRRHWLNRWAARTPPDVLVANSRFIAADADGWFPGVPIRLCNYPLATPDLTASGTIHRTVRAALGTAPDAVVILQASRLESWKGQRVHLEALGRLRDLPGWEAWFAGGPQMTGEAEFLNELKATAVRLGIADRVKFLGQRADVPDLMRAADVFCQPNTGPEPFGVVFVEALHAGLPVVTSDLGAPPEFLDAACAVLAPPGDATAVADALAALIRAPERRAQLGAAGPARAAAVSDPARQLARFAECLAC